MRIITYRTLPPSLVYIHMHYGLIERYGHPKFKVFIGSFWHDFRVQSILCFFNILHYKYHSHHLFCFFKNSNFSNLQVFIVLWEIPTFQGSASYDELSHMLHRLPQTTSLAHKNNSKGKDPPYLTKVFIKFQDVLNVD